ncbi:MAG: hypothetical protein FJY67_08310 [Calditrichaeota bacterium]|nr:hypothetical protein [Calditrichota bacterium]
MKRIPVEVTGITIYPPYQGYMVILHERDGDRWIPIFIGGAEAHAISLLLNGQKFQRPLTYDLFHALLEASGARVEQVIVTELRDSTFFAEVLLLLEGGVTRGVDARPSDAVALALKTRAPIYVNSRVMDEAGLRGEIVPAPNDPGEQLKEMQQQLQNAIDQEAYEDAAKIRDRIKAFESRVRTS